MTVGLGPAKGKDFVGAHVLGPVLVTADEIPDPYVIRLEMSTIGILENRLARNKPFIGTLEYPFKRNMGAK